MGLPVGELARRTGVGVSTLRAWERRFQFLVPERSPSGHRRYGEEDVERVEAVLRLVADGMTLPAAIARVSSAGIGAIPEGENVALFLHQIVQAMAQAVLVARRGRMRFVNRRAAEMLGYTLDELIAVPVRELFEPADYEQTAEVDWPLLKNGTPVHVRRTLVRRDGSRLLAELDFTPLFDQAGRYDGSIVLARDVTAEVGEQIVQRCRAVLLDLVEEAALAANPSGEVIYLNAAAERLLGGRASELLGRDGRRLLAHGEEAGDAERIRARLMEGRRWRGELALRRLDGEEVTVRVDAAPAHAGDGTWMAAVAVATPVSEERRLEHLREGLAQQLETLALLTKRAMEPGSAEELLNEALGAVRRLLGADGVAVLDVVPGKDVLRIRSSLPSVRPGTTVPSGSRSLAGYVALAGRVVVVDDAARERRLEVTTVWGEFAVRSAIGAPVHGRDGIIAVLTAGSTEPGRFDVSASHFVQSVANVMGLAGRRWPEGRGR